MRVLYIFNLYINCEFKIFIIIFIAKIILIYIFLYINIYIKNRFDDIKKKINLRFI